MKPISRNWARSAHWLLAVAAVLIGLAIRYMDSRPAKTILRQHSPGSPKMCIVLAFPFAGAYAGMAVRKLLTTI